MPMREDTSMMVPELDATSAEKNKLPPCDKPHVAEAIRNEEEDEACDDGIR